MASLTVNGAARNFDGDASMPLLWYLRDELQMTGTKFGCGMALCGACTVHLDGAAVRSCSTPMSAALGKHVTTIEQGVPQCGYCQSGQIMQAAALLSSKKKPSDQEIEAAMSGNICRCGTYTRIKAAIKQAAGVKEA